jgi:predicted nucleic acid-binding protein
MALPVFVLDASAALALVLADEGNVGVDSIVREVLDGNGQVFVPSLFWYELGNSLLIAQRRSRITPAELEGAHELLRQLPIVTNAESGPEVWGRTIELARSGGLSFYDAAYLELALRLRCRLKTLDTHLLKLRNRYSFIR